MEETRPMSKTAATPGLLDDVLQFIEISSHGLKIAMDEIVPKALKDSSYMARNRYILVRGTSDTAKQTTSLRCIFVCVFGIKHI